MSLNKQKGNMYPWVTHTWNPIRGKCPHDCSYCYMKRIPNVGELRFVEKEMYANLGKNNKIFIGSSTDIWTGKKEWIEATLNHCLKYLENIYFFQSKFPLRFYNFTSQLADINSWLATTIETNRYWQSWGISKCSSQKERAYYLEKLYGYKRFISIEPIMDFDLQEFVEMIKPIHPEFISIGADSGHNNLPEPPAQKVKELIKKFEQFTEVRQKDNLKRLL